MEINKTQIEKSKSKIFEFSSSKTQIEKRLRTKTDSDLVETIIKLKKKNLEAAKLLARPKRLWASVNLDLIDKQKGDVFIGGKVLSQGELSKPVKIVAWGASEKAMEKIKKAKAEFVFIVDEVKKNPELKNLVILK